MKNIIIICCSFCLSIAAMGQSVKQYEYDKLNRLTKVTYANGTVVQYTYDAVGNRLTKTVEGVNATTTQSHPLSTGWNWWTPIVSTTIENIQTILNSNLVQILEQEGIPSGDVISGKMYKIETNADCSLIICGTPFGSAEIIIYQGINWFGFIGIEKTVAAAFASFTPALGDKVVSQDGGFAIYNGTSWKGTLASLVPGNGYVYVSNDATPKTLVIGQ